MVWAGAMGSVSVSQILNITQDLIVFFDFSGGGLTPFDPSHSDPSGLPWGIKGVLLLYLKTNTSLLHAQDLTRPRPQGPGELGTGWL